MHQRPYTELGFINIKPGFTKSADAIIAHCLATIPGIHLFGAEKVIRPIKLRTSPQFAAAVYPDLMEHPEAGPNIRRYMGDPAGREMLLVPFAGPDVVIKLATNKAELRRPFMSDPPSVTENVLHIPKDRAETVANCRALLKVFLETMLLPLSNSNRNLIEDIMNFNAGFLAVEEFLTKEDAPKPDKGFLDRLVKASGLPMSHIQARLKAENCPTTTLKATMEQGHLAFYTESKLDKTKSEKIIQTLALILVHDGYPNTAVVRQRFIDTYTAELASAKPTLGEGADNRHDPSKARTSGKRGNVGNHIFLS